MTVIIPVDKKDQDEANIVSMNENHIWAHISIEDGKIANCNFVDDRTTIVDWIDCVVVINEKEYVWPFMEEGMVVLIAPIQRSIDDIIEAFLFKELHDLSV